MGSQRAASGVPTCDVDKFLLLGGLIRHCNCSNFALHGKQCGLYKTGETPICAGLGSSGVCSHPDIVVS